MDRLKGTETLKELKSIIKENEIFSNIKMSGKGRTKLKIMKEMNDIITKYNNSKSKQKLSKTKKLDPKSNQSSNSHTTQSYTTRSRKRKLSSTKDEQSPQKKRRRISKIEIQDTKCGYITYIKHGFFTEAVRCHNIIKTQRSSKQCNICGCLICSKHFKTLRKCENCKSILCGKGAQGNGSYCTIVECRKCGKKGCENCMKIADFWQHANFQYRYYECIDGCIS